MCGRYFIEKQDEYVQEVIDAINRRENTQDIKAEGEVFPSDIVPTIANNRHMKAAAFPMKWGYTSEDGRLIINARSETAAERTMFKDGMAHRRCIIPASHYFEWEQNGRDKIKYAIAPSEMRSFFMAGLYRIENGSPVFVILTREPAEQIAFIHDRMPVLMPREMAEEWLDPRNDAQEILKKVVTNIAFCPEKTDNPTVVQTSLLLDC